MNHVWWSTAPAGDWDGWLSIAALSASMAGIGWALYARNATLTLLQTVGAVGAMLWCGFTVMMKFDNFDTEPRNMLLHLAMAAFVVGCMRWDQVAQRASRDRHPCRRAEDRRSRELVRQRLRDLDTSDA